MNQIREMTKEERDRQEFYRLVRVTLKKINKLAKLSAKDFPKGNYPSMDGVWEFKEVDLDIFPPLPDPFPECVIDVTALAV